MPKSHKNIAHILPWSAVGGTERATLRLAQAVASRYQSEIFCLDEAVAVRNLFAEAGFETISYQPIVPSYRHLKRFLHDSYALAQEFKRMQIDIVHCSDILAAYYAAVAGRMANLPVVCHVRCRHEEIRRRDANFLRAVNEFIFVSQDTWRTFGHYVSGSRGHVIYDGIDIPAQASSGDGARERRAVLAELGLTETTRIIGMVARVAPAKDYETLAKSAAAVAAAHPDTRFLIVGDNSLTEVHQEHYRKVKNMLVTHGVADRFIFTGFREDVPRMISAMDVFVLSTHFEGFPLVLLEAMAQGKAVVATAVDGIPEIIHDGETGLLYPHGDHVRLAEQMVSLLNSDQRLAALGQAGREFVRQNFSTERFATRMMDLYESVINGRSRRKLSSGSVRVSQLQDAQKNC